jgi:hypothetical protein
VKPCVQSRSLPKVYLEVWTTPSKEMLRPGLVVGTSRQERRSNLGLQVGEAFNSFRLFDGALIPSEILRAPISFRPRSWSLLACCSSRVETEGRGLPSSELPPRSHFLCLRLGAASVPWKAKDLSAESRGLGLRTNSSSCGMRSTIGNPDRR